MKQINLIPWREYAREQQKRQFFNILIAAVLGTVFILLFIHMIIANAISNQKGTNYLYEQEITQFDQKLTDIERLRAQQKAVVERINIIDQLQATRSQTVNIFSDMVKAIPQGIYLISMKRVGDTIAIAGRAESNTRVSTFMRNLEALPWLEQASLNQIQTNPAEDTYNNDFVLLLKLKSLKIIVTQDKEEVTDKASKKGNKKTDKKANAKAGDKAKGKEASKQDKSKKADDKK